MLKAQLPIDEKVGYADFVIHNEGSLEETRRQVEDLWESLKRCKKGAKIEKPIAEERRNLMEEEQA